MGKREERGVEGWRIEGLDEVDSTLRVGNRRMKEKWA